MALLVATSVVTFALVGASPVDPVRANVGQASYAHMSAGQREELEQYWGSSTPIWQRYAHWAAGALRGDLGESLRFARPVTEVVGERFASSAALMLAAWLLAGAGGLVLGVAMGTREGGALDRVALGACYLLSSTPAFWLGLLALMVFCVWLGARGRGCLAGELGGQAPPPRASGPGACRVQHARHRPAHAREDDRRHGE